jgi:phosphate starvation-inducible PhoH-like protein
LKRNQKIAEQRIVREKFEHQRKIPQLHPKTQNQQLFMDAMRSTPVVIGAGSAGVGKSLLACWWAASQFTNHRCKKIVLLRAYQPLAGRSVGFRPGSLEDKLHAFYIQLIEYLEDFMGKGAVEVAIRNGEIELGDLESIRGRSWDEGTLVIAEEFQNMFVPEVQAITTRMGEGSQLICIGDDSGFQTDVKRGRNGLEYLISIVEKYKIPDVEIVRFTHDDIVRSGITKDFVLAYEKEMTEDAKPR